MPRWCVLARTEEGVLWIDMKARRTPFEDGKPLAHVDAHNITEAMTLVPDAVVELEREFAFRFLLKPFSDQGWISPAGRFWGCDYYAHDDIAHALIRKTAPQLEYEGWARVHSDSFRMLDSIRGVTRAQERTLIALGFEDPEPGARRARGFQVDSSGSMPSYAVKPPEHLLLLPPAEAKKPSAPRERVSLKGVIDRLRSDDDISALIELGYEEHRALGKGTWRWLIQLGDIAFGSEEKASNLLKAPGLALRATSFDTIEIDGWPRAELSIDSSAKSIVAKEMAARGSCRKP
ncbi:hypothetical protein OCUBac02_53200 (plasmid) [Bosea sp. ANAM02]|nr:hypothetical protein OCUBac02_53200 [Bosea sp. ANAM02]